MKILVTFFALWALALPAAADVTIQDIVVRRQGQDMNIRVSLYNSGSTSQQGIRLVLYVRSDSRNWHLRRIASNPAFEARATLDYPGGQHQEKISVYRSGDH
jgi:hypothetical protein